MPPYSAQPNPPAPKGATASMVLGIVALSSIMITPCFFGLSAIASLAASIVGLVLGYRAKGQYKTEQGTAGIIMNWIAAALSVLIIIVMVVFFYWYFKYMNSYLNYLV